MCNLCVAKRKGCGSEAACICSRRRVLRCPTCNIFKRRCKDIQTLWEYYFLNSSNMWRPSKDLWIAQDLKDYRPQTSREEPIGFKGLWFIEFCVFIQQLYFVQEGQAVFMWRVIVIYCNLLVFPIGRTRGEWQGAKHSMCFIISKMFQESLKKDVKQLWDNCCCFQWFFFRLSQKLEKWLVNCFAVYWERQPAHLVPAPLHLYFKNTKIEYPHSSLIPYFEHTENYISFSSV